MPKKKLRDFARRYRRNIWGALVFLVWVPTLNLATHLINPSWWEWALLAIGGFIGATGLSMVASKPSDDKPPTSP